MKQPDLEEDERMGWPNSVFHGNEFVTPLDDALLVILQEGNWRLPHGEVNAMYDHLKRLMDGG